MNNKEFISELSQRTGYTAADTQKKVLQLVDAMNVHFMEGDSVSVTGFGLFEVKKKLERIMVNPGNGQRMLIPPKLVLSFKASPAWKYKMNAYTTNSNSETTEE